MLQLCRLDGMADRSDRWSFSEIARRTASVLGSSTAFALACVTVVVWAVTGPIFGYSDTWQLVINTGTTIVTFLMVFLVQNTQNRDARALHLKLDELLRSMENARNKLIDLENCSDDELAHVERQFQALKHRQQRKQNDEGSRLRTR
jgi:low affinity Fe/Cu permease